MNDISASYNALSLTAREQALLQCLAQQKDWTKSTLSQALGCSTASVDRAISSLTDKKLVAREGADKKGAGILLE